MGEKGGDVECGGAELYGRLSGGEVWRCRPLSPSTATGLSPAKSCRRKINFTRPTINLTLICDLPGFSPLPPDIANAAGQQCPVYFGTIASGGLVIDCKWFFSFYGSFLLPSAPLREIRMMKSFFYIRTIQLLLFSEDTIILA